MRETLLIGALLALLAVGVVHANREDGEGAPRLVQAVDESQEAAASAAVDSTSPAPAAPSTLRAPSPAVLEAGELSVLDGDAPDEPMVRYFDASGSLHMVQGLDRVPPEFRAKAVVLGSGNVNTVSIPAPSAVAFQDWEPEPNPNRSRVVLYSAPWCGACKRAKRHLDRQGIVYRVRDISLDDSAKEEVRSILGRVAIPLLDVNGRYISGFNRSVYDRALGRV